MLLLFCSILMAQDNPLANSSAMVISGHNRFTVLTPEMIRLEWSPTGHFEDHASFIFVNRKLDVPKFTVKEDSIRINIETEKLRINYLKGSGKFTESNLEVTFFLNNKTIEWRPGMGDSLNLRGTTRTLDGWNGGNISDLEPGLISRKGWAFIDDSQGLLFDNSDWPWVLERPSEDKQDWYFLGYGHNYKKCLADFNKVAGEIPIPPKFAFGYWWSRYWVYSDSELRELVQNFKSYNIPIDVLIIDMDWHETYGLTWSNKKLDPFGQAVGWTGYTWNRSLFPEPEKFLSWTESRKLKTALNLHPASGISPMEEKYEAFAKALGFDTGKKEYIPFQLENKNWATIYFNVLLKPFEEKGIDFWWLDWQQWPESKSIKGLSNTWWLNYTFFTHMEKSGKRPVLFHRWGGLGNHRYQIGFSGDAIVSWESLKFQPFFTATASNVGYGYWSHDIGGHNPLDIPTEAELYLRWIQFGVFSPILRTHATKSNVMERRFWMFPEHFSMMQEAINLRYALVPYIYSCAAKANQTGISICRPMYYEWPEKKQAYDFTGQYYFGDDMIIAPVCEEIKDRDRLATQKIWLPEGRWYSMFTDELVAGDTVTEGKFALDEIPVYIKAGAIIPMYPTIKNLQDRNDTVVLLITPGGEGNTTIYEDDGNTQDYLKGEYTTTGIQSFRNTDNTKLTIRINPSEGHYKGMQINKFWEIRVPVSLPPKKIDVDGLDCSYSQEKCSGFWTYHAKELMVIIKTLSLSTDKPHIIELSYDTSLEKQITICNRKSAEFRRLSHVIKEMKHNCGSDFFIPDRVYSLDQTHRRIEYDPNTARQEIESFTLLYKSLPDSLSKLFSSNPQELQRNIRYLSFGVTEQDRKEEQESLRQIRMKEDRVKIKFPYSREYPAQGITTLIDGKKGSLRYFDQCWQGYHGVDLEISIDLEQSFRVKEIQAGFIENQGSWIFLPSELEVWLSDNGSDYELSERLVNPAPDKSQEVKIKRYLLNADRNARYVKLIARNIKECPSWHQGFGEKAWLFSDEIEIIKSDP
ncbi:MAG: glycoside hydrolase family 31 protein [Bacteroidales bacterium]